MLDYSVSYFLGDYWSHTPLYSEKIIPLLDYLLNNGYEHSNQLASCYFELINKYQNPQDLPVENIRELIKEQGYDYIVELISPTESDLKILINLLVLIHLLKGSTKGLEIVLSIFSLKSEPSDIEISQWYDEIPVADENTFNISTKIDMNTISNSFFQNFDNFIKNYVYPSLTQFKALLNLDTTIVVTPISQIYVHYNSSNS